MRALVDSQPAGSRARAKYGRAKYGGGKYGRAKYGPAKCAPAYKLSRRASEVIKAGW